MMSTRNKYEDEEFYGLDGPINKPEKTMKLRYIGETFGHGVMGLTNGKIYEAWVEDNDYYRVIDDEGEDYLYPRVNPRPCTGDCPGGHWEIVEE